MLTYDAVLCIQERLYDNSSALTEAAGEVVTKAKLTPATILEKARKIVESLIQILAKAVQSFGTFLRNLIDEGKKEVGEVAKKIDKAKDITGMQIRGYPFSGLTKQVAAKYKGASLDKFFEAMKIPRIETMDDLHALTTNGSLSDSSKLMQSMNPAETRSRLIEYMTGIRIDGTDPNKMNDELMLRLWGSRDPIVLTANKEFTLGESLQTLVSPPLAKSVLLSYRAISKKLYSVKKLLPFITKRRTAVGKAERVERNTERALAHSDEYAKKYKLTQDQATNMDTDLQNEVNFMRTYIVYLKNLSRDMNRLNKALLTTVSAQHRQARFIVRKAITYKTVEQATDKHIKKAKKADEADPMNARAREYTKTNDRKGELSSENL